MPLTWQEWSDGWDRSANNLFVWPLCHAGVEPDIVGNAPGKIPVEKIKQWEQASETNDSNQGYKVI
jgi:hypothetical protein